MNVEALDRIIKMAHTAAMFNFESEVDEFISESSDDAEVIAADLVGHVAMVALAVHITDCVVCSRACLDDPVGYMREHLAGLLRNARCTMLHGFHCDMCDPEHDDHDHTK